MRDPLRVLVVHNRYRSSMPSGENVVVDEEIETLRAAGVHVETYLRSSDEIPDLPIARRAAVAVGPIWAKEGVAAVDCLLAERRPNVLHLHNPYPLISPGVIRVAHRRGVPVVQTVHNRRHVCAKSTYFRDGQICTDCLGKRIPWPAVVHGCYRDSRLQSLPMATALAVHRGTWRLVSRFLALTEDLALHLGSIGIPAEQIVVRPNTVEDPGPPAPATTGGWLFAGRLSEEKGLRLLAEAWRRLAPGSVGPLTIVGDGPEREVVERLASERPDVQYMGPQPRQEVTRLMRSVDAVIVPSTWPESFPRVVVEALACGRPVLATRLGGLPYVVTPDVGWICEPQVEDLARTIQTASGGVSGRAAAARHRYEAHYSPAIVLDQLLALYEELAAS